MVEPPGARRPRRLERKGVVEAQLVRGTFVSRDRREQPFLAYYDRWAASRQISVSRRYTDDQRAAKHVLPYWGNWPICDIKPSDIDDWIALLAKQMGPVSVRHCYALLRGPLRRAIKDRVIDNPCIDIALPKLPDIRKTFDDVLTAEESERLVNAVADPDPRYASLRTNGRYRALVFMGCWLGPRWKRSHRPTGLQNQSTTQGTDLRASGRQPKRDDNLPRGDVEDRRRPYGAGASASYGRIARAFTDVPTRRAARRLCVSQQSGQPPAPRDLLP